MIDPRSDRVVYVGQTSNFEARKARHIEGTDQLSGLVVRQIKLNGFVPIFIKLEECRTEAQSLSSEIFWIELFRARGIKLTNAQSLGGYRGRQAERNRLSATLDDMAQSKADTNPRGRGEKPNLRDIANGRSLRRGKAWTATELKRLKGMLKSKMSIDAIADALERTPSEVRRRIKTVPE